MQLDVRTNREILEYLKACAPLFLDKESEKAVMSGPGEVMARIFSEMTELVIKRLNKAPENNLLAFLDVLGVRLLPPQPAVVPLTFKLSTGAPGGVLIPKSTAASCNTVQFETDKAIWAVPQTIAAVYAYDSNADRLYACPAGIYEGKPINALEMKLTSGASRKSILVSVNSSDGLLPGDQIVLENAGIREYATVTEIDGQVITLARPLKINLSAQNSAKRVDGLNPLEGDNLQEHLFYIGHENLFDLKSGTAIKLTGTGVEMLTGTSIVWEYWGEEEDSEIGWKCFDVSPHEGSDDNNENESNSEKSICLNNKNSEIKKLKIGEIESRWIRCRYIGSKPADENLSLENINLSIQNPSDSIPLDAAFYNDIPVNLDENPIKPFGTRPRQNDSFYFANQEVFSKAGAEIKMTFTTSGKASSKFKPTLVWEYWNGVNWKALYVPDSDFDLLNGFGDNKDEKKDLLFTCPPDVKDTEIGGIVYKWIRVRIAAGNYDNEIIYNKDSKNWVINEDFKYPQLSKISLSYKYERTIPPEYCLTLNNLTCRNLTTQHNSGKPITPFEFLKNEHTFSHIIYFGFNGKLEHGPVSIFFSLSDDLAFSVSLHSIVRWYYYTESHTWQLLETSDNTYNLSRSGTIEFRFPSDFASQMLFGKKLFWIKATFDKQPPPSLPALKVIYINTVPATQTETISGEILGGSDTHPNQKFFLKRSPVIDCSLWVDEIHSISEKEKETLKATKTEIRSVPGRFGINEQCWVEWKLVSDFLDSNSTDRHYTLDETNGKIVFGDGVRGMIPSPGSNNIQATYRVGGGAGGNVGKSEISTLTTSIDYIDKVYNPLAARGGGDAETIDSVKQRGPFIINHRNKAVTIYDFERLALQASSDIKRVKCYTHGRQIHVIVIPNSTDDRPKASLPEKERIERALSEVCLNTVFKEDIKVLDPLYIRIKTNVTVVPETMEDIKPVQKQIQEKLRNFFHPITGGDDGKGWEFGRDVHVSDLYAMLGKIKGIDHVSRIHLSSPDKNDDEDNSTGNHISINNYELVCTGIHEITMSSKRGDN